MARTFGVTLGMINILRRSCYQVLESYNRCVLCFKVKQAIKQKLSQVTASNIQKFAEIWVQCLHTFLSIYLELLDEPHTKGKVYEYSLQLTKLFADTMSE